MADTRYVVDIAFNVDDAALGRNLGALSGRANDLQGAWRKFGGEVRDVGRGMADAFTGAVDRAGAMAVTLGKVGIGAGIAAAAYGVGVLNNQLEQTTVSIGAVLNSQGQANGIARGMEKAADIVANMRQDAKELPGEFSDLLGIFQSGVGAAGNAGLDAVKFEKLAANAMAAGKALSVPLDQAGRELAMLLDGRAGAHNVFGTRLGIRAQGFNEKGPEERVKMITEALDKFQPAIRAFGGTFDAIWSSAVDNVKQFGTQATAPLFGAVKDALGDFNKWFDDNKSTVSSWANRIGSGLRDAFGAGRRFIEEWGPAVMTFASNAYDRISQIWKDIEPTVRSVSESIKSFLTDTGSFDKILDILKLYGTIQAGQAAMPLLSSMAGLSGAGAAAPGMLGAGGGAVAGVLGTAGTVALAVGAVTIAAQVANLLGGTSGKEHDMFQGDGFWSTVGNLFIRKSQSAIDEEAGRTAYLDRLVKTVGEMDMASAEYQRRMGGLIESGDTLAASLVSAAAAADHAASVLGSMSAPAGPGGMTPGEFTADVSSYIGLMNASGMSAAIAAQAAAEQKKLTPKGKGGGGGGSMKVEITINSNQSPGQISRAVVDRLQQLRRHPNSSTRSPTFTAPRG